ncbi:hypothetical protein NUSPORA_02622 [Nucleospora cyclopteri]
MGIKESIKQKNKKNRRETIKNRSKAAQTNSETSPTPSANRLAILHSIFDSFKESPESEWPIDAYQAIRTRLGRMSRGGWELLRQTYWDKFSVLASATEVKKFATNKQS